MQNLSCDVLIAGGGVAGISAALAAARNGADVILLEKQCVLGGLATSGLITIYLPLCDGRGTQLSFGIAEELFHLSILHGAQDKYPDPWLREASREERSTLRFEVQFNPVWFSLETEELLLREHVRILYDYRLCGACCENGHLKSVTALSETGMQEITFRTAVDATGSAVLCRLCGEKTLPHANGNSAAGWYYGSHAGGLKLHMLGFADIVPGSERDGQVAQGPRFTGDTGEDVNVFLYQSHAMTLSALRKVSGESNDFLEPALMTSMPQLRMIRRLDGEHVMTEAEDGRPCETSIGMVGDWRKRGPRFEVPYEILYSRVDNLYAAGRIVSCDDGMWDILRVIPCCAVTGEAAGTAAALECSGAGRPSAAQVQERLRLQGQKLHFTDLEA